TVTEGFVTIVRTLHHKGVKARYIGRIVSELNAKVFQKVFALVFPESWHDRIALAVMGSEGREEQILRTDQDNALVLADGFMPENLQERAAAFSDALRTLGFPDCPGGVMVENPAWRKSVSDFKADIDAWIDRPEGEATLKLAILTDARCVAGEASLLEAVRSHLFERMAGHPTALGLFAQAVERFEIPLGWFGHLGNEKIDIKKGGIFILMHGVRALSLERRIEERPTVERLKRLSDIGLIDRPFATELIESYDVLLSTQLTHKLDALARGQEPDNRIDLAKLSKLERDMVKDALRAVKKLKEFVAYHFKLSMVG
ncbi:putative nucleotidyltransferase substrate binding domain-containing protein, partial [Hydrogenimonas sp.]